MQPSLFLSALAAVYGGWQVEEAPLVAPPWQPREVEAIGTSMLGVIATQPDAGSAVFAVLPGERPVLLRTSSDRITEAGGTGTGFTASDDGEIFRIRPGPAPALVSLGRYDDDVRAVTCDEAVSVCVLVTVERGPLVWRPDAGVARLAGTPDGGAVLARGSEQYDPYSVEVAGAAVHPTGRWVGLSLSGGSALLELGTGAGWVVRGGQTWRTRSLSAFVKDIGPKGSAQRAWQKAADACNTTPQGWADGKLELSMGSTVADMEGSSCPLDGFLLDPVTGKRTQPPAYPWSVLDCPTGGWSSAGGTFVTRCLDDVQRMMRGGRRRALPDAGNWPAPDELPEAVALSERHIFVMAAPRKQAWKWYRGAPKGKGLEFLLEGPSVIEFVTNGVLVEQLPQWRFQSAVFAVPLDDDWHLIQPEHGKFALVRFTLRP